jgi:hypothetical protein
LQAYHKKQVERQKNIFLISSAFPPAFAPTGTHRKPTPFLWCQGDVTVQEPDNPPEREVAYLAGGIL